MDRRMSDLLTECDQFVRDIPITLFERRSHAPAKNPCLTKYHCLISVEIKREVAEIRYVQRGLYGLTRRCRKMDRPVAALIFSTTVSGEPAIT